MIPNFMYLPVTFQQLELQNMKQMYTSFSQEIIVYSVHQNLFQFSVKVGITGRKITCTINKYIRDSHCQFNHTINLAVAYSGRLRAPRKLMNITETEIA
jgi:hypothetical protein